MASTAWPSEAEIARMKERAFTRPTVPRATPTYPPALLRRCAPYLDQGNRTSAWDGRGGGTGESVFRAMADAIQVSKRAGGWRTTAKAPGPLTGSVLPGTAAAEPSSERWEAFEPGYELDMVVLTTQNFAIPGTDLAERWSAWIYLFDDRHIAENSWRDEESLGYGGTPGKRTPKKKPNGLTFKEVGSMETKNNQS